MPEFDFYNTEAKLDELISTIYEYGEATHEFYDCIKDLILLTEEASEGFNELADNIFDLSLKLTDARILAEDIALDFTNLEGILDNPETEFDVEG